ncbi:unnamed protein product [Mytilus coruscus]|uniref:Integrase zinc-binding domain-containing protein n=1 Tax=Mytilus coruscus TaxID=42192 RepID=A0A6J8AXM5_MYTCO|nr:unnamed protein product [Mytilus coruscus]
MKIGDVVVSCILDTGSMVSTISESFFNKMLKSNFELHQDKSWLRLRAANGLDIPYVGYIETDVCLPLFGETIKDRGILILKDSPGVNRKDSSGLIGMNIISQCKDLFETINNSVKPENSEIKGFARVAGNSEICVPANSVSIVTVVGPTQTRSKDKIINIEPLSRNTEVMVIDSVSTTERNRYPVRIANLKSADLWLKPNTRIGVIREVTCLVNQEKSEVEFFKTNDNKAHIKDLLAKNIIKESISPYTTDVPTDLRVIAYQRTVESIEYEVEEKHEQPDKDRIFKGLCNQVSALPRYSNSDMKLMQNSDNMIKQFLIYFNEQRKPSSSERMKESPKVISMLRQKDRMFLKNGILYRKVTDPQQGETHQFVVPEALQKHVLEMLHEQAGHQGIERTTSLIRSRCYWTGMFKYIDNYCKTCERCNPKKMPCPRISVPMSQLLASQPNEILAIDFTILEPASDDSDRHVYLIEPIDKSGQPRVENRTNLQVCKFKPQTDSDSSSDEDPIAVGYNRYRQLRRSNRSNFGEHSNVYNEPRSTV